MEATASENSEGGRKIWWVGMSTTPSTEASGLEDSEGSSSDGGEGGEEGRGRERSSRVICTSLRRDELSRALFHRIPFERALLSGFSNTSQSSSYLKVGAFDACGVICF